MLLSPTIYLQKKLQNYSQSKIVDGVFRDVTYETSEGLSFAIIAGTYEKELFPVLSDLKDYTNLIVIGAGDGYYAAGLLSKFNNLKLHAFEILPYRKINLLKNLASNSIKPNRYEIYEGATVENLKELLDELKPKNDTLIIIDVEGYEKTLLNIEQIPTFKNCSILVELHDHLVPNVSDIIKERFVHSHEFKVFKTSPRTIADIKKPFNLFEKLIFKKQLTRLIGEGRGVEMEWFFLSPLI